MARSKVQAKGAERHLTPATPLLLRSLRENYYRGGWHGPSAAVREAVGGRTLDDGNGIAGPAILLAPHRDEFLIEAVACHSDGLIHDHAGIGRKDEGKRDMLRCKNERCQSLSARAPSDIRERNKERRREVRLDCHGNSATDADQNGEGSSD